MDKLNTLVEPRLTSHLFSKAAARKLPLSGTFELSPVCNFSCRMCYVRKTAAEVRNSPRKMLTCEQWLSIAEQAREAGMLYLLLTGGEPLLWPDFWELYEKLCRMGFVISINTNGSLIDDAAVEHFRRLPPSRINITLYGSSDETYEALCGAKNVFSRVDGAIKKLRAAGINVKLNGSLTPYNVNDLEKCVTYAQENGLIYETVTYMFPPLRRDPSMTGRNDRFTPREAAYTHLKSYRLRYGNELYSELLRSVVSGVIPPPGLDDSCIDPLDGRVRCRAGKSAFWITWDGLMTPCGMMTKPTVDISNCDFPAAWEALTQIASSLKLSGKCANCKNISLCHSCAAMAMAETGDCSGVPTYLCETVKELKNIAASELTSTAAAVKTIQREEII